MNDGLTQIRGIALKAQIHNYAGHGVYFLCDKNEIVYVGQSSISVLSRIYSHLAEKRKIFDSAFYIRVKEEELMEVESAFIRYFKPKSLPWLPLLLSD